jgi:hypothetical protein
MMLVFGKPSTAKVVYDIARMCALREEIPASALTDHIARRRRLFGKSPIPSPCLSREWMRN